MDDPQTLPVSGTAGPELIRIKAFLPPNAIVVLQRCMALTTMDQSRQRNGQKLDDASNARAIATSVATPTVDQPVRRRHVRSGPTVSWYSRLLIVGALLVAAGWEIFRLLLTIITLD